MSQDFKPSTRKLLQAMGWENKYRYKSPHDENYLLHEIVVALGNRTSNEIGLRAYRDGTWPLDVAMIEALGEALPDNGDNYAGQDLAYALLRAGVMDDEVLARLHPWDGLVFKWRNAGLNAADIAEILYAAGTTDRIGPEHLTTIDAWIAKPLTALGDWVEILDILFGLQRRLLIGAVRNKAGGPEHHTFLRALLAKAAPPIEVEDASQSWHPDLVEVNKPVTLHVSKGDGEFGTQEAMLVNEDRGFGVAQFRYSGKKHGFLYADEGSWVDVAAVVNAVDRFMADLARPDRVFQFERPRGESGEHPAFVVADANRFIPAAERLALPLASPTR